MRRRKAKEGGSLLLIQKKHVAEEKCLLSKNLIVEGS